MKKGGYLIIDFGDVNITSTGVTVPGIHQMIESSYRHRKAILISGVTLNGVEQRDCFVDCTNASGNYTFSAYGKTFTISAEDKVTIA